VRCRFDLLPNTFCMVISACWLQDLLHHPDNGWSMLGLSQVAQARRHGVADATEKFESVWRDAEVSIQSSCPMLARPWLQAK